MREPTVRNLFVPALALLAGCGSSGGGSGDQCFKDSECKGARICVEGRCADPPADLGIGPDLVGADLTPPPDLTFADLAPPADMAAPPDVTTAHGNYYRYLFNRVVLPAQRSDFALDLNGDGRVDNQLGNIIGALQAQNIAPQTAEDLAVGTGQVIHLLRLQTADAQLATDDMAGANLYAGKPGMAPRFDGNDQLTIDANVPPGIFLGRLAASRFTSNNPPTTKLPVDVTLSLYVFSPTSPVTLPLHGAAIRFTTDPNGLMSGQINGSVKDADVKNIIVPQIAQSLNAAIQMDPNSNTAKQILAIFDIGNCTNPDMTKAVANDGRIDPCEVATNPIIQNVLAPDVDIYDANGNYAPNPLNTGKDSLSIGVGFSAVHATF
jgi:hypothetical protein